MEHAGAGAAAVANAFAVQIVALRREGAQADIQRAIDALNVALEAQPTAGAGAPAAPDADPTQALRNQIAQLRVLKAVESGGVRIVE